MGKEYWGKRFEYLEKLQIVNEEKYIEKLAEQYTVALERIKKEINNWFTRFAVNNQISLRESKKWLNTSELKELQWDIKEYIRHGEENGIDLIWKKELENASAKVHISRLNALMLQIQERLEELYAQQNNSLSEYIIDTYKDTYYNSAYALQSGFNVAFNISAIDESIITKLILNPWTADGMTFSDRIWRNKKELIYTLQTELTQAIIRGDGLENVINKIAKKFNTEKNKAGRLVMTETAFFSSQARKQCFNDLWVKKYEIVATLDSHTSQICRGLDGKVFNMKDYSVGITAPPFHVWCRSTTAPYFNDEFEFGERAARNTDGKTYYVPSDMKYSDWYNEYVNNKEYDIDKEKLQNKVNNVKIENEKIPNNINDFYNYILKLDNKEEFETLEYNENGYITGQRLNSILKYDGLPRKVTVEEFNELSKESDIGILYRGISAETAEKCQEYVDNFKNGKFYSGGQAGHIYGKGTYTGFSELGKKTAMNYAEQSEHGQVIEMILDKNAKIANYYDLFKEVNKEVDEFIKNHYQKYNIDNYMQLMINLNKIQKEDEFMTYYVLNIIHDVGYNASIKGYDAIIADNGLAKQKYVVILNRSKVIIHE